MSLTLSDGRIFSELEVKSPHGVRGHTTHRLEFQLEFDLPEYVGNSPFFLSALQGELRLAVAGGQLVHLSDFKIRNNFQPIVASKIRTKNQVSLICDLSPQAVDKIEAIRSGAGVRFGIYFQGLVIREGMPFNVFDERQFEINQGTWIEILDQMGYQETFLLEISSGPLNRRAMGKAGIHFENSVKHFRNKQWRDAIGNCRDAIETVEALNSLQEKDQSRLEFSDSNSKERRIKLLRKALKHFNTFARHSDPHSIDTEWTREDAVLAISTTVGILRYEFGAQK